MENGIASLEAKYQECLAKKEELDNKFQLCGARLIRADKVRRMETLKLGSHQIRQCGENAAFPIRFEFHSSIQTPRGSAATVVAVATTSITDSSDN